MTYVNNPPHTPAIMAFFYGGSGSQQVAQNGFVSWAKTGGSSKITISGNGASILLPQGYVWSITTQILLYQNVNREFLMWNLLSNVAYAGAQKLAITPNDTGSRIAFNVISTESGDKYFGWKNTQSSISIDRLNAGMQIIGVPK